MKFPFASQFKNKKLLLFGLIFVVAFIVVTLLATKKISWEDILPPFLKKEKAVVKQTVEEIPVPVKGFKVVRMDFRDNLPSLGVIKGVREIELKFQKPGMVEYVNFKQGERVAQGDIIASLDQKEELLKLEYAKLELEKHKRLFELGSIEEMKLRQTELEYESAKAELEKTNMVAPADGFIGVVFIEPGTVVSPSDKVASFSDFRDVYVEFGVIEKDIGRIKEGENVEVVVDTYPDHVFKGRIDSISPFVEGKSRTQSVRARLSNPDEKLQPGMFARVSTYIYEKEKALLMPAAALKKKESQYVVYVIHSGKALDSSLSQKTPAEPQQPGMTADSTEAQYGTVEIRPIEIAYATPDAVEVKSGLEEGELIIADVQQDFEGEQKVEIAETQESIF